jgi:hypothetical protein
MTTPRPSLLNLHPVEALLALLLISAAAMLRLVIYPPRPIRPYSSAAIAMAAAWEHEPTGSGIISPVPDLSGTITSDLIDDTLARMLKASRRRQPTVAELRRPQPLVRVTGIPLETSTACAVAARAAAEHVDQQLRRVRGIDLQPSAPREPTVADLRRMVRARGLSEAGGRPISKARRADLIDLLCSY